MGEYVKYNLGGKSRIQNTIDSTLEKKYTEIQNRSLTIKSDFLQAVRLAMTFFLSYSYLFSVFSITIFSNFIIRIILKITTAN